MKNQIIEQLMQDQVVTVPTETVYGYAVRLASETAIKDLMELKERDYNSGKVFTLVPATKAEIRNYVLISSEAQKLIDRYLPGEITLILPKNPDFHHFYYDHFETIGIRIPDHELFAEILPVTGPLLLTSANPKGGTPKSATGHLPSTIVDCTKEPFQIIRQGSLEVDFMV